MGLGAGDLGAQSTLGDESVRGKAAQQRLLGAVEGPKEALGMGERLEVCLFRLSSRARYGLRTGSSRLCLLAAAPGCAVGHAAWASVHLPCNSVHPESPPLVRPWAGSDGPDTGAHSQRGRQARLSFGEAAVNPRRRCVRRFGDVLFCWDHGFPPDSVVCIYLFHPSQRESLLL